jgi:hypothetical protein
VKSRWTHRGGLLFGLQKCSGRPAAGRPVFSLLWTAREPRPADRSRPVRRRSPQADSTSEAPAACWICSAPTGTAPLPRWTTLNGRSPATSDTPAGSPAASSVGFYNRSHIPNPAKTSVILVTVICDLESGTPRLMLTVRQQGHSSE